MYMSCLHQLTIQIELNSNCRGAIEPGVFKQHCSKILKEVCEHYNIDSSAIGRSKQKQILSRIDIAVIDALLVWPLYQL